MGTTTRRCSPSCFHQPVDGVRAQPARRNGDCPGPRFRDVSAGPCGHPCAEAWQWSERTRALVRPRGARARQCPDHGGRNRALTNGALWVRQRHGFRRRLTLSGRPASVLLTSGPGRSPLTTSFWRSSTRGGAKSGTPAAAIALCFMYYNFGARAADLTGCSGDRDRRSPSTFEALTKSPVSRRVRSGELHHRAWNDRGAHRDLLRVALALRRRASVQPSAARKRAAQVKLTPTIDRLNLTRISRFQGTSW